MAIVFAFGCGSPDADRDAGGASSVASANAVPGFGQRYVREECRELPEAVDSFEWFPPDLPLPDDAYPVFDVGERAGFQRGVFAAKIDYLDFSTFTLEEWAQSGWILARAENEPGEAESAFIRGTQVGAFRARQAYCDDAWSEVLITLGPPGVSSG